MTEKFRRFPTAFSWGFLSCHRPVSLLYIQILFMSSWTTIARPPNEISVSVVSFRKTPIHFWTYLYIWSSLRLSHMLRSQLLERCTNLSEVNSTSYRVKITAKNVRTMCVILEYPALLQWVVPCPCRRYSPSHCLGSSPTRRTFLSGNTGHQLFEAGFCCQIDD